MYSATQKLRAMQGGYRFEDLEGRVDPQSRMSLSERRAKGLAGKVTRRPRPEAKAGK